MQTASKEQSGDYFSNSTIDSPPREPREGKQKDLFNEDEHEKETEEFLSLEPATKFEFSMKLTIKGKGEKATHTIPVVAGTAPADMVEELLGKYMQSAYFKRRLRAVIGVEPNQ